MKVEKQMHSLKNEYNNVRNTVVKLQTHIVEIQRENSQLKDIIHNMQLQMMKMQIAQTRPDIDTDWVGIISPTMGAKHDS